MAIRFTVEVKEAAFHEPGGKTSPTFRATEVREDPLTRRTARIVYLRGRLPAPADLEETVDKSRAGCPFCPERIEETTPDFPADVIPGGKVRAGEAILFPNTLPYDAHTAVGVLSRAHYVPMDAFPDGMFRDGLLAARRYLELVLARDPSVAFCALGWNYMPFSGGSIVHPHVQVIAGDRPTNYHREMVTAAQDYFRQYGRNFWDDYLARERQTGDRYLGQVGTWYWLVSFFPKGLLDVQAVLPGRASILDLDAGECGDLARGLNLVLRYYHGLHFRSFNLALYSVLPGEGAFTLHARVIARYVIPPFGTSDTNYLQTLHDEFLCMRRPEEVAEELRHHFAHNFSISSS